MFTKNLSKLARITVPAAISILMASPLNSCSERDTHSSAPSNTLPMVLTPAPGFFRMLLGDFEITALSDGTVELPVDQLLSQDPIETIKNLAHYFLKAPLETSVNAYLINTGTKLILIDVGAGSLFGPTLGKLLINLRAAGYDAAQVNEIYLTHIHPDHVGGLMANGIPAFANAIVRANKLDSDYWLSAENLANAPQDSKSFFEGAIASINPYVKLERYKDFSGELELSPGISTVSTFGHTKGHTSFLVQSKDQKMLILGDLIHVAAVQLDNPSVTIAFDVDATLAAETRRREFTKAAEEKTLVAASHMQFPGIGHLRTKGEAYEWIPVNYTQMH